MGRESKPWWRKSKRAWYVEHQGRQIKLGSSKGEAMAAWHKLRAAGEGASGDNRTVASMIEAYLADSEAKLAASTLESRRRMLGKLASSSMGPRLACSVDAEALRAWIIDRRGWGDGTRWLMGLMARACWRWAGLPLGKLGLPSPRSRGDEALIAEEGHRRLMEGAPQEYKDALGFLRATGCRPGEMCALEAKHIDAGGGLAVLPSHKTAGKTGKPRVIVFAGEAVGIVARLKARYPEGRLFRNTRGVPLDARKLAEWVRNNRGRAGLLPGATPYGYRHTLATDALAQGVPDAHVAALLGHGSTAMLHKHYSHLTSRMDALREAAARVRG